MAGNMIKESRYVMSNVQNNNNKFWYAELYDDGTFITRWGRVGEAPNITEKHFSTYGAEKEFDKKCKEKEKKGYALLPTLNTPHTTTSSGNSTLGNAKLAEVAKKQIEYSNPLVERLISRLTTANVHSIMGATKMTYNSTSGLFSTPCGVVTQDVVDEARALLTTIGGYIQNNNKNGGFQKAFEDYLMKIPQDIGRVKLKPELVFPDIMAVQRQNSVLDALEVSIQSVLNTPVQKDEKTEDDTPKLFDVKLELVEDGKVFDKMNRKVNETRHYSHASSHLKLKTVYSVDIKTMGDAFEKKGKAIGGIQALFHGSRVSNCLSILKQGLIIPPSRAGFVTGRLYGDGCYFSDQSSKSLNYSFGFWDGKSKDNNCMMFVADVAMGKSYIPKGTYDGPFPKSGFDSVFAKAGVSGIINNEMIIYHIYQCNLIYLLEFSPGGK
jgi:poly [ADP-ribose] polymerase